MLLFFCQKFLFLALKLDLTLGRRPAALNLGGQSNGLLQSSESMLLENALILFFLSLPFNCFFLFFFGLDTFTEVSSSSSSWMSRPGLCLGWSWCKDDSWVVMASSLDNDSWSFSSTTRCLPRLAGLGLDTNLSAGSDGLADSSRSDVFRSSYDHHYYYYIPNTTHPSHISLFINL